MNLINFTTAIGKVFTNSDYEVTKDQLATLAPPIDVSRQINIDNLQSVFTRLLNTLNSTNEQVKMEAMSLAELISLRKEFYEARNQLAQLEEKETQDVAEIKRSTKWHERSKFVRLFVTSKVGEQLEIEEAEAKEARSAVTQFSEELEDLESVINYHILNTGENNSIAFKELVQQWRTVGQLKDEAQTVKSKISAAYANMSSGSACWNCGRLISTDGGISKEYLSSADRHINNQLSVLTPWYNRLTTEVEGTIDRVREKLSISF